MLNKLIFVNFSTLVAWEKIKFEFAKFHFLGEGGSQAVS